MESIMNDDFDSDFSISMMFWLACLVIFVIGGFVYYAILPTWNSMEVEGIHHSKEYVTTKVNLLYSLKVDYDRLGVEILELPEGSPIRSGKEAQKRSILLRIDRESKLIRPEDVPPDISYLLEQQLGGN